MRTLARVNLPRLSLALMSSGILMLVQPFWLWAFTWSFAVILIGTISFIVTSHLLPEGSESGR